MTPYPSFQSIPINSRILVALSGGVDSGVCAQLLTNAGYQVEGIHMSNWEDDDGYCSAAEDLEFANLLCEKLKIPLHQINFSSEYKEKVFIEFIDQLNHGLTPNPDIACNTYIKFGALRDYGRKLDATILATGHYAKIIKNNDQTELHTSIDDNKDQTYFLYDLTQEQLSNIFFPLGDVLKNDVRAIAKRFGLPMAEKKDSTGICFIGERPFKDFLLKYISKKVGYITDIKGNKIGEHIGLPFYTLGQRQGLKIGGIKGGSEKPWFVAKKNYDNNTLIAVQGSDHPMLFSHKLTFIKANWINEINIFDGLTLSARIRHRQKLQDCLVEQQSDQMYSVTFSNSQRAITPGQHIVLYSGTQCLGGGVIHSQL
jgi:tRNA-uridine 2-sulfurtransferase